jgi:translation initiation factor IF-1
MANEAPIVTQATITEELVAGRLYQADLPNGKSIPVHIPSKKGNGNVFTPGDVVTLEMTPYDFSKGRIRLNVDA